MSEQDPADMEWLFDAVMQIFSSAEWVATLGYFIDDNCKWFADEEENAFKHTELHREYCTMAENILEQRLEELGVTPEQFVQLCEWGRNRSDVNRTVFDQITAIDDFLTFKTMMTKRNMQLNQEVIEMLQRGGHSLAPPEDPGEEEDMLRAALRMSEEEAAIDEMRRRKSGSDSLPGTPPRGEAKLADETPVKAPPAPSAPMADAEPEATWGEGEALAAPAAAAGAAGEEGGQQEDAALEDAQVRHARLEAELAELEHDIAAGVAHRAAHLETLHRQVEEARAEEEEQAGAGAAAEGKEERAAPAPEPTPEPTPEPEPKAAPAPKPAQRRSRREEGKEEKGEDEGRARAEAPRRPHAPAQLPPLRAPGSLPPVRPPLPSRDALDKMSRDFQRERAAAERVLSERTPPAPAPAPAAAAGEAQGGKETSAQREAELERRRAYLQRQRERLLAIRRQEAERSGGNGSPAPAPTPTPAAERASAEESKRGAHESEEERRRRELREALGSQLREEVQVGGAQRALDQHTRELESLRSKLERVDHLRRERTETEAEVRARLQGRR